MAITFADVPLLLEDPEGRFQDWLDRNLSLEDLRLFGAEPAARACTRNNARSSALSRVGLPLPNWPAPPKPKINTLWWPCTGAARWAVGYFLVDSDSLELIEKAVGADGYGTLEMTLGKDASAKTWSATMYMLAPRRLSALEKEYNDREKDANAVWLLPLVDQRYLWQFRDSQSLTIQEFGTTWTDVVNAVAAVLGATVTVSTPRSAYQFPDPTELTRQYENAAVLLDVVAECLGARVVVSGDDVALQTAEESHTAYAANLEESADQRLAGGAVSGLANLLPSKVTVVFPKTINREATGRVFAIDRRACCYIPEDVAIMPSGTARTIFDTAEANYVTGASSSAENLTNLTILADAIAADYYAWRVYAPDGAEGDAAAAVATAYEWSFAGLAEWTPCGFDNAVEIYMGHQRRPVGESPAEYACFTRVSSLPCDFGVVEMNHQTAQLSAATTTTTTTTTTPNPGNTRCQGQCRFIWSAADNEWTLDQDNCNTTTTTTTSTTTTTCLPCRWQWYDLDGVWNNIRNVCDNCGKACSPPAFDGTFGSIEETPCADASPPTTASTPPPCDCMDTTTTAAPTTTTTAGPTTTTTPSPTCKCLWPKYCGSEDGECTSTECVDVLFETEPPDCGQSTTTTTTTSTTTTTPDPECHCEGEIWVCPGTTTTTTAAPVCSGCEWVCCNNAWQLVSSDCSICNSTCPYPTASPAEECNAHTDCEPTTTTVPPPDYCLGTCHWACDCGGEWRWVYGGCSTNMGCCTCPAPSGACDCHATTVTFCAPCNPAATTTTTTYNPCTTTTSTSTTTPDPATTTTTTTVGPCDDKCKWGWDGAWVNQENPCAPSCPCVEPYYDGADLCEVAWTPCNTTTTSTTTTTTTTCVPPGECSWILQDTESGPVWAVYDNECCAGYSSCTPIVAAAVGTILATTCVSSVDQCPTTPPPCTGCGYLCTDHVWMLAYNRCGGDCTCHDPPTGKCAINGSKVSYPCVR